VTSFDLTLRDTAVIAPLVLAIVAFAVYPQRALKSGEQAVKSSVHAVRVVR
jgi:NADH-quinone oxidoreductase subunit M